MTFGQPRHTHACDACADCVWLGQDGGFYDLYCCTSDARGVVLIARYGDRPHDYASLSLRHYHSHPDGLTEPFHTAYVRARNHGVVP